MREWPHDIPHGAIMARIIQFADGSAYAEALGRTGPIRDDVALAREDAVTLLPDFHQAQARRKVWWRVPGTRQQVLA
ncbi:MAG: hypothetical protein ACU0CI_03515 [Shimia sp.]